MLLRGMDSSEKWKKPCGQGAKWNILKMFPTVPCIKYHLPWNFRQTDRQTDKPTDIDENIPFAVAEVIKHSKLSIT